MKVTARAYAKINLSLDILGARPDGYHEVDMVMQLISLHDLVTVSYMAQDVLEKGGETWVDLDGILQPGKEGTSTPFCTLTCDVPAIPVGPENLAVKAASLLQFFAPTADPIHIHIEKKIPMAAGLAGGSADGAAVLLALPKLWGVDLPTELLLTMAGALGADVPFVLTAMAVMQPELAPSDFSAKGFTTCARATGSGTTLSPLSPLQGELVLAKPDIAVSTGKAYGAMDEASVIDRIEKRPDTAAIVTALGQEQGAGDAFSVVTCAMANVFEAYTPYEHPEVAAVKAQLASALGEAEGIVQMSGTGPTMYLLTREAKAADTAFSALAAGKDGDGEKARIMPTLLRAKLLP